MQGIKQSAMTAVQAAVYKQLKKSNFRVYDNVPATAKYPFIKIGECEESAWGGKSDNGSQVDVKIDCWSKFDGTIEVKDMCNQVVKLLTESTLTVAKYHNAGCLYINTTIDEPINNAGEVFRHGLVEFSYYVSDLT